MQYLGESGQLDDTIVVVCSANATSPGHGPAAAGGPGTPGEPLRDSDVPADWPGTGTWDVAGGVRDQYHHAVDVVPTILDCAGVDPPQTIRGHVQGPLHGVSMRYTFPAPDAPSARQTQLYRMPGARAIYHAGWKAVAADGPAGDGRWELFHVSADRAETHDVAARHPQKVAELAALWQAAADRPGSPAHEGRDTPELLTGSWPQLPSRHPSRAGAVS